MDIKDIQKHIDKIMNEQNNRAIPKFEGYSPFEMHKLLHFTFGPDSPIQFLRLSDTDYQKIPILNQIKYLADLISKNGEIKLTKKGFLPTKIVADLYDQGFIKDKHIESGITKLYKETDSITINLTRILPELSRLTKKRKGKLSLTKSGEKTLFDDDKLLKTIFETFTTKFNWAYYDGYGENHIGQLGYGFSLILLSKYGQEKRLYSFYAEKYFKAFPQLLESIEPSYGTVESYSARCYSIRTFERFLDFFGLIKIDEIGNGFDSIKHITKTDLFDKFIKRMPHS
ncbi:MAG: hypothetical protein JEY97_15235 [Bacteroidales bacterium]|nr:hypothetical protein [Bacteroidales bacterium]